MKNLINSSLVLLVILASAQLINAQKKAQTFTVSEVINAPIDEVWQVVGEDYGSIAYSHPKIVSSNYVNGSLKGGEGAERVCNFNEKGTQFLKEKQLEFDRANYTFKNQIFQAGKFPVDPAYTFAYYKLEKIDDNSCKFIFTMNYRTKPAMMGGIMKGNFKNLIADYAISVNHYVNTGEKVTKENFKEIKKEYKRNRI